MTETVVIRGGDVVGRSGLTRADVLVREGKVAEVAEHLEVPAGADVVDACDAWVGPGFVDLHSHLREPGGEDAETVESGARAAALGGYSAIVAMPNTEPPVDGATVVTYVLAKGRDAIVDVTTAGAITLAREGRHLAPMAEMAALGVRLFTDDGRGVQDPDLMRRALAYARGLGVRLAEHCEDESLAAGGVMNEGALSSRLGLAGRPALAEELMLWRDLELVRLTGGSLHVLHLTTARALELVRGARADGLDVTCEVAPHHFTLDESACESYDTNFKVHPPLRARADVDALRSGLGAGEVDAVATDHAPHAEQTKDLPFDEAPPGMLGLEHAASLTHEALGLDSPVRLFDLLSRAPSGIARLRAGDEPAATSAHGGDVAAGEDANLVVFDPRATWSVDRAHLQSRSANTPYHGRELTGRARALLVRGRLVVTEGQLA
jgi:dihydroorotase